MLKDKKKMNFMKVQILFRWR